MNSGAGHPPEGAPNEVVTQLLTAEARSAIVAASKQVVTFADQQRPVWATLLEGLMPLARNMAAVFRAPRAASYERLLIEMGYKPVEGADNVALGNQDRRALGERIGRVPTQARLSPARNRQGSRSEPPGEGAPGGGPPPAPR